MANLLNYSSYAVMDLKEYQKSPDYNKRDVTPFILKLFNIGVKFMLLDDGRVFDLDEKIVGPNDFAISGLPYPVTILEFPTPRCEVIAPGAIIPTSRRITFAVDFDSLTDDLKVEMLSLLTPVGEGDLDVAGGFSPTGCYVLLNCVYIDGFVREFNTEMHCWEIVPFVMAIPYGQKDDCYTLPFGKAGEKSQKEAERRSLDTRDIVAPGFYATVQLCTMLSCQNVTTKKVCSYPLSVRRKRSKKKKPIFEYHVLVVKPSKSVATSGTGTHASPRIHLRRGHRREFAPNKFTWVQACVVGSKENGVVYKDYSSPQGKEYKHA